MTMTAAGPRLVKEGVAAQGLGLDLATFRDWVESGRLPEPIEGLDLYDRKALDAALDRLSGIGAPSSALDAWRERRHAG